MGNTTALVIANGDLIELDVSRRRIQALTPRWVIAADGGSKHAQALGLRIDILIGDLDSLDLPQVERLRAKGTQVITHRHDKDETDLELALVHAASLGASEIVVLGAIGNRLDMTLSDVLLLLHPALQGIRLSLWHGRDTAFFLRPPGGEVPAAPGDGVSLIPLAGDALGVRTEGLAFALRGETLRMAAARGVSNLVASRPARVELGQGTLLVVIRPRAAAEGSSP